MNTRKAVARLRIPQPAFRLVFATVVCSGWLVLTVFFGQTAEVPSPTPVAGSSSPSLGVPALGLSGCAARGCHGGPTLGDNGELLPATDRNACSLWLKYDRHSNAYRVLFNDKSKRMVELLAAGGPVVPAHRQERCLACHTMPAIASLEATPEVLQLRTEGVSCEACHTAPGRSTQEWIEPHKTGWEPNPAVDWYALHGMNYVGTTATRAQTCAGCHVGAPANPEAGIPLREVNHDLIAAGHPRLNFEYATYLDLMPPHWSGALHAPTGAELPPPPPGEDVLEWYVGQLTTAAAALDLLADEAGRAETVWPEFTAFNCYGCHFDFTQNVPPGSDWRRARAGVAGSTGVGGPGRVPWNRANLTEPILRLLRGNTKFQGAYEPLAQAMDRLGLKQAEITPRANNLRTVINELAAAPPDEFTGPAAGLELVWQLRLTPSSFASMDWDDAAQLYYALRAANRSRDRVAPTQPRPRDEIDAALDELARQLRFPRGEKIVNSPVGYDPDKVGSVLAKLPERFEAWYAAVGLGAKPSR